MRAQRLLENLHHVARRAGIEDELVVVTVIFVLENCVVAVGVLITISSLNVETVGRPIQVLVNPSDAYFVELSVCKRRQPKQRNYGHY